MKIREIFCFLKILQIFSRYSSGPGYQSDAITSWLLSYAAGYALKKMTQLPGGYTNNSCDARHYRFWMKGSLSIPGANVFLRNCQQQNVHMHDKLVMCIGYLCLETLLSLRKPVGIFYMKFPLSVICGTRHMKIHPIPLSIHLGNPLLL